MLINCSLHLQGLSRALLRHIDPSKCAPGCRYPAVQERRGEKHQLNQNQNKTSPCASKRRPDVLLSLRFFDLQASFLRLCSLSRLHLPSPFPPDDNKGLFHN